MTTSEFWEQQKFSYLVTYSFNRGPKLVTLQEQLQRELQTARFTRQSAIKRQLQVLEQRLITLTEGLSDVHPTATIVAKLTAGSVEAQRLAVAFHQGETQEYYAMCWPIYRDALAFYNEAGALVRVLNICFECLFMQTDKGEPVEAGMATYKFLREFLIRLGHPIVEGEE